jgi:transcriptional regulator GlxA family with amidase domain
MKPWKTTWGWRWRSCRTLLWLFAKAAWLPIPRILLCFAMDHFIADQYTQPLTLGDIARAAGVSRQHLLKLCWKSGKPTPMQQLYNKRLEIAADLLLQTGSSVGEIAERCGFVNVFHFSRKFKEAYHRSPLTWRNSLWKMAEQR